jgi:hypothetical protein
MDSANIPHFQPNLQAPEQEFTFPAAQATLLSLLAGAALHAATKRVIVQVKVQSAQLCPTGGVPTATLGIQVDPGQSVVLSREEADACRVLRLAAGATGTISQYL